jgi:hypothetical protein
MGNNCGCVEKEGESEVVVGQPGKMKAGIEGVDRPNRKSLLSVVDMKNYENEIPPSTARDSGRDSDI